jgi:hypothetical protein
MTHCNTCNVRTYIELDVELQLPNVMLQDDQPQLSSGTIATPALPQVDLTPKQDEEVQAQLAQMFQHETLPVSILCTRVCYICSIIFALVISADGVHVGAGVSDLDNVNNSPRSEHWRTPKNTARPKGGHGAREGEWPLSASERLDHHSTSGSSAAAGLIHRARGRWKCVLLMAIPRTTSGTDC